MEVKDFINDVANQEFGKAGPTFVEIMRSKMDDALEQEKISVAGEMFGQTSDEDEESDSYGTCIEEEPADNTILYVGGGLIALAVVATLMKK